MPRRNSGRTNTRPRADDAPRSEPARKANRTDASADPAQQRHETHRGEFLLSEIALAVAAHADQGLAAGRTDRCDEHAGGAQLIEQLRRHRIPGGGKNDRVERRLVRPAELAVVMARTD